MRACLTPEVEGPEVGAGTGAGIAAAHFPSTYCCTMSLTCQHQDARWRGPEWPS